MIYFRRNVNYQNTVQAAASDAALMNNVHNKTGAYFELLSDMLSRENRSVDRKTKQVRTLEREYEKNTLINLEWSTILMKYTKIKKMLRLKSPNIQEMMVCSGLIEVK